MLSTIHHLSTDYTPLKFYFMLQRMELKLCFYYMRIRNANCFRDVFFFFLFFQHQAKTCVDGVDIKNQEPQIY